MSCLETVIDELQPLFDELAGSRRTATWGDALRKSAQAILAPDSNGHFEKWHTAKMQLPDLDVRLVDLRSASIRVDGDTSAHQREVIRNQLMKFHPWRKGPFDVFGVHVDAEWRSDLKWDRLQAHLDLAEKDILDIGCGNGYYGWRMLGCGARRIIGIEPYPLYVMQHNAIQKYLPGKQNYVVPATDSILSNRLELFDVVFSMGVLYHAKDPIGHLGRMRSALKQGSLLVLETLVVDGDADTIFVPPDRYAKMRNVWFLPSPLAIEKLLKRVGFRSVDLVEVTPTTPLEQRQTRWMTFESLSNFLSTDGKTTIEGHAPPTRAILLAR